MPISPSEVELVPAPKPEHLLQFIPLYIEQIDARLKIPWLQGENSRGLDIIAPPEREEYYNCDLEMDTLVKLYKDLGWKVDRCEPGFGFRLWFQRPVR